MLFQRSIQPLGSVFKEQIFWVTVSLKSFYGFYWALSHMSHRNGRLYFLDGKDPGEDQTSSTKPMYHKHFIYMHGEYPQMLVL